jgi:hypothetical protein
VAERPIALPPVRAERDIPHEPATLADTIADATADLERTRARMVQTQRDVMTCVSLSREIIAESWLILGEADRLLALRTGL